jgi:hypothetical protein
MVRLDLLFGRNYKELTLSQFGFEKKVYEL